MSEPGYTRIIVRSEVRGMLQKLAEAQGYRSINRLLEAWLKMYPTTINREVRRSETGLKTSRISEKQFNFWRARGDLNPRPSA